MVEWNDLRIFLVLSRSGTLATAARTLGVDPVTVGRRLAALERGLGTRLFKRTPKGYRVSEAGQRIAATVENMEESAFQVERTVAGEDARLEGTVRITCTDVFAVSNVLPHLRPFAERYPNIELQFMTAYQTLDINNREADIAVRLVRPRQPELIARRAGEIVVALYSSGSYLRRKGEADSSNGYAGHEFVGYSGAAAGWLEAEWLTKHARGGRMVTRVNSVSGVAAAVGAGVGMGLLPCLIGDADQRLERVNKPPPALRRDIWLVVHRDLQANARVRVTLDFLTDLVRGQAPELRGEKRSRQG